MRDGVTSTACIEADTSMASMTIASSFGTRSARVGRAKPTTSVASAAKREAAATWRRQPGRFGAMAARSSRLVKRTA